MRRIALALATLMAATVFSGCSGSDGIDVTATFEDIGDLANGAPVTMADIQIGKVKFSRLAGNV
jgi:ABC-type transporter Mla subunit MlaD